MGDSANDLIRFLAGQFWQKFGPSPSTGGGGGRRPILPQHAASGPGYPLRGLGSQAYTLGELGADSTYLVPPRSIPGPSDIERYYDTSHRFGRFMANRQQRPYNSFGFMPTYPSSLPFGQAARYQDYTNSTWPYQSMSEDMMTIGNMSPEMRDQAYERVFGGFPRLNRDMYDYMMRRDSVSQNRGYGRAIRDNTPEWYLEDLYRKKRELDSLRYGNR